MIDKFRSDAAAAVAAIPSGATLAVGGFGSSGRPDTLLDALCDLDRRDLHVIVNNVGGDFTGIGRLLLERRIHRLTASFPVLPEFYDEYFAGRLSARNFNPLAAMSGRHTFAEVEHLVGTGELGPDDIHLAGVFVDEVLLKSELSPRTPTIAEFSS